ncbi:MAG: tetratricopeptide repeat protein [Lentimicrobiaceae bacterium]|jgi:tetratricopeptide (TPR) repeat protein|nr:tetratricopeptide repeat protein [Lentimicrobiaceae bacterium]
MNTVKKGFIIIGLLFLFGTQQSFAFFETPKPQVIDTISKYGADSVSCITNLSLYREYFKQWRDSGYKSGNVKEIITPWRQVFIHCPRAMESTYVDGATIIRYFIDQEKDAAKKGALIDTLMMVYDQRIKYFPTQSRTGVSQIGTILGRKGADLYNYAPDRYAETHDILLRSIEMEGLGSDGTTLIFYFRSVIKMATNGDVDSTAIIDAYDRVIEIAEHNMRNFNEMGDTKKVEVYRNIIGSIESNFEPFANCEDLVNIYNAKFKANPDDIDLLRKITSILDKKACTNDPLYLKASVRLHELQPSPESAYLLGRLMINEEKYSQAITYLEEATKSENPTRAHGSYKLLAQVLTHVKNYSRARQMAYKAIELDPMDGSPYITIGDMYAASAKDCGSGDFYSRVAYWAAVDKYQKARQVDSSIADIANKRIATYSQHFPSTESIFFHTYHEGDTYTVECWINEKTTIRAAK